VSITESIGHVNDLLNMLGSSGIEMRQFFDAPVRLVNEGSREPIVEIMRDQFGALQITCADIKNVVP
jgi:hypothetical protein